MSRNAKISAALVAVVVLVGGIALFAASGDDESAEGSPTSSETEGKSTGGASGDVEPDDERLVRPDSPRLSEGQDATFVEFLDFECEACASLYPTVEEFRQRYGDRVTFVVRYLPLHTSSVNAAKAAEAARAQGRFEDMYSLLFERQDEWGHQDTPEEARFFTYAEELGLDMAQFESVFNDPATGATIEQSAADASSLGATGTPTLFLDGELLKPESVEDLTNSFDAALAN